VSKIVSISVTKSHFISLRDTDRQLLFGMRSWWKNNLYIFFLRGKNNLYMILTIN